MTVSHTHTHTHKPLLLYLLSWDISKMRTVYFIQFCYPDSEGSQVPWELLSFPLFCQVERVLGEAAVTGRRQSLESLGDKQEFQFLSWNQLSCCCQTYKQRGGDVDVASSTYICINTCSTTSPRPEDSKCNWGHSRVYKSTSHVEMLYSPPCE